MAWLFFPLLSWRSRSGSGSRPPDWATATISPPKAGFGDDARAVARSWHARVCAAVPLVQKVCVCVGACTCLSTGERERVRELVEKEKQHQRVSAGNNELLFFPLLADSTRRNQLQLCVILLGRRTRFLGLEDLNWGWFLLFSVASFTSLSAAVHVRLSDWLTLTSFENWFDKISFWKCDFGFGGFRRSPFWRPKRLSRRDGVVTVVVVNVVFVVVIFVISFDLTVEQQQCRTPTIRACERRRPNLKGNNWLLNRPALETFRKIKNQKCFEKCPFIFSTTQKVWLVHQLSA